MTCNGRENIHYALFRVTLKNRQDLLSVIYGIASQQSAAQRDSVWIEIPIERHPSMGDKTIHSEILITQRK